MTNTLTADEIQLVSHALAKLNPGLLPKDIFIQVARLMTTCTVVLVPLFQEGQDLKVLLTKRSSTDSFYPNMYHPIGTILRASDENVIDAFQRLYAEELSNPEIKTGPVFVNYVFDMILRGREVSLIHWVELSKKPDVGDLFNVDKLPNTIIKTDIPRIKMVVEHYLNQKDSSS